MNKQTTVHPKNATRLGVSGRIAQFFLHSHLTPLLAGLALLLGLFATFVTPREEEPQIDVTMANVLVPFPGASVREVTSMVAEPAEHVLSQMQGIEHVMSVSRPGLAIITVQFKVGVPRNDALVRLYDTVQSHADWLPKDLGTLQPIIKPKGIDDVPVVVLTLHSPRAESNGASLERIAHSIESELKRVKGTREVVTVGGPGRAINIEIDPAKMSAAGITITELGSVLRSANAGAPVGQLIQNNRTTTVELGNYLSDLGDVAELIVAQRNGKPIFLRDLANVRDGAPPAQSYVWYGNKQGEREAVMLAITKKVGENAIDVANALITRVDQLKNNLIPADVEVSVTRNYGETANDKASKLIQKLLFATLSVVVLVGLALGKREALIVGIAVILTLASTLFASWAWGFTLNRVSLFALIFSIGILVDDAIVVVENIHRHQQLFPGKTLSELIPNAVDEVGGPTILATLTVIAALLPMAFVSGLMGPYMAPIPINASMGMLLSLAIAFVITPWLARVWMRNHHGEHSSFLNQKIADLFERVFSPLLDRSETENSPAVDGRQARRWTGVAVIASVLFAVLLPMLGWVVLKMLPFDNKSEFQIVIDMPGGTPLEKTAALVRELSAHIAKEPDVVDYVASVGTSSPINFNGLVRQYYLRSGGDVADIQVQLLDKHARKNKSHEIATRIRPALVDIAKKYSARVKVIEVPPGPPVLAPIVAEIYGPDETGRRDIATQIQQKFRQHESLVDIDSTVQEPAKRTELVVDRKKAAHYGIAQSDIVHVLQMALSGKEVSYLHDGSRFPVATRVQLAPEWHGSLDALLQMQLRASNGVLVPIRELVNRVEGEEAQALYRKDLLPVSYVVGDVAGKIDSPLYGMFALRKTIFELKGPDGHPLAEYFVQPPQNTWNQYAVKWDGEWQITYETFRDMGAAYAVGLVLIYILVVAQFGSYLTPLIIMAPIPLTIVGVMPGHALLGAQFTATSMIGMIALAGIIVRNSILLVDFIQLQLNQGVQLEDAIVQSAAARAQPIVLTGLAAMTGALFILDDPIFNGLAISLVFGIAISTVLTLVIIPLLYYIAFKPKSKD